MVLSSPWRRRLLVLATTWTLAAGLWVAFRLMLGQTPITHFQASQPAALAVRVRDAVTEMERGSTSQAVERLLQLRREDPLNPMIHALLGQAWARDPKTLSLAISSTRMALTLDPSLVTAYYNLACYQARGGDKNGAWATLVEAIGEGLTLGPDAGTDPDLAPLREDPRFQLVLQGGPATLYAAAAAWKVEPEQVQPGDTVTLQLDVWDLSPSPGPVQLHWLGSSSLEMLSAATPGPEGSVEAGPIHHHIFRWQVIATRPWRGELGPFDLRVGDERVSAAPPGLIIEAGTPRNLPPVMPSSFFDLSGQSPAPPPP